MSIPQYIKVYQLSVKRLLSFITTITIALLFSLSVYGVAQALTADNQSSDGAQAHTPVIQSEKDILVVGSEQDYPPFATGLTDATAGGFTVDLWKAVAAEAGLKYTIRVLPFHELLKEFKAGKIDVLINLAISKERHDFADFTVPHAIVHGGIFARKGKSNIRTESDLAGKSIIVLNADLAHDYAVSKGWGKQLVLVDSAAEGMRLLASGKHDAMLISKLAGIQTLQALGLSNIEALKVNAGFSQKFAFAVHKGQSELLGKLNEGLALIKTNGTYDALYEKWFGIYEVKEVGWRDLLKYLLPILFVFLCIAQYSNYRRKIERKAAHKVLQESEAHLRMSQISGGIGTWEADLVRHTQKWSDNCTALLGIPTNSNPTWDNFLALVCVEDRQRIIDATHSHIEHGTPYEVEYRVITAIKNIQWMRSTGQVEFDANGKPIFMRGITQDITARRQTENALRIAATAFESQEGMMVTDANNNILRVNAAFTAITGYTSEEAVGQTPALLNSGRQDKVFYEAMWERLSETGAWEGEIWNRRKNGEVYPEHLTITAVKDASGIVTNYVATLTDITKSKAASDEIENLAFYDPLTRLPNRRLLMDRLQQALATSTRSGLSGAVLFLDLDHFKTLNDTLGHDVGDLLLQQVANRLSKTVREGDTVARLGGDEFVVLLEDLNDQKIEAAAQTEAIAQKILTSLNQPYQLGSHQHHSTASVGVTLFNDHEAGLEAILKQADIAMYQSKKEGRNTIRFYDPKMQEAITTRVNMEHELRQAIAQQQFQLYYQIQVDNTGRPLGAEALIRWNHPERNMIPPLQFIPLAEETGLILPIGQWVLDTACAQLAVWHQNPYSRDLVLSVNVSAKQFHQANFVTQVQETIQRHRIDPTKLKLELTESMLVKDIDDIIEKMNALSQIGVRFSLDDFGTGYSSLQYLKKLPLSQLKIDQSFVRDIVVDESDLAIVSTIIAMAHSLNLGVIAEGVETEDQRQCLLGKDCTNFQGYLFGKPVPIEQFEASLTF